MKILELANVGELLNTHFKKNVEILDQNVSLLTSPGEHFGSVILKVDLKIQIDDEVRNLNLAAKQIPASELLQKAFDFQVTFRKESFAYTVSIPTLLDFQKEFNSSDDKLLKCFPECFGARYNLQGTEDEVDKNAVILFDNLKSKGYQTIDRLTGFDLDGAKFVLKNLAILHAVPLALRLLRPDEFNEKVRPSLVRHNGVEQLGQEVVAVFHDAIMHVAKQCKELEPYLDRVQKVVDYYATHPFTERPAPSKEYGTMCHCDIWTSNIMVLKDSNDVITQVKLLDLQLTNYTTPIRDLIFFLFTSVQNDILEKNLDGLIKSYYEYFIDTLNDFPIDLEPYSWENFNKELEKVAPDEVYHVLVMLKIVFARRGKVTNTINNFELSDWTRQDLIGDEHKRKMRDTVLALVSKNWI